MISTCCDSSLKTTVFLGENRKQEEESSREDLVTYFLGLLMQLPRMLEERVVGPILSRNIF